MKDSVILKSIKQKAIEEHIPIIMDDTLKAIDKYLKEKRPKKVLEIGTAVRIFCNLLFKIFS